MPRERARRDEKGQLVAPAGGVVVRMYRQGLGDCFLLAFGGASQTAEDTRYVLIDCGVHARQTDGTERLAKVLADLQTATGGRLDVVVATHEHADHLSGFVQKGSPFLDRSIFTIKRLWLAWTEKRGDKLADRLRSRRATARKIVERAVEAATSAAAAAPSGQNGPLATLGARLEASFGFEQSPAEMDEEAAVALIRQADQERQQSRGLFQLLEDASPPEPGDLPLGAERKKKQQPSANELALGVLQAQARNVKYCLPGDLLKIDGIEGVRVHVLGPPHDEAKLKKDLPSKIRGAEEGEDHYKETYLSAAQHSLSFGLSPALGADMLDPIQYPEHMRHPFDYTRRRMFDVGFPEDEQYERLSGATQTLLEETYFDSDADWRRIDADWLSAAADLVLNLDSDTNNTSLVLAFEWNDRVLLFVGDAQVGNWLSWRDQTYRAERGRSVPVDHLLARTVLYKVGHHGSHNATLKRDPRTATSASPFGGPYGLELMRDIIALIPVDRAAAEKDMPSPWEMPHQPLYERLREKARRRVLRSDAERNVRPLAKGARRDVVPESIDDKAVPDMLGAVWMRSEETLSGAGDPLYYEIAFEK
jgi:hypothetical protein